MEYTVKKLGNLAGVSTRTLRYYDEIGILKPARINSSGYRIYEENEIDRLQQIMFYRELGVSLDSIKEIITSTDFNETNALKQHYKELLARRQQLDALIENVEKTINNKEGRIKMSDKEKFDGFKQKLIEDNEKQFGKVIREKYGEETVKKSNQQFSNMTEEQYNELQELGDKVLETLKAAYKTGNPAGELGQKVAKLHKEWITFCWGDYNTEAHANLTQMYVDDERFKTYYDKEQPGCAEFLRDAVWIYTGMRK
ncbi:DNA-binding transcriptional MerR regulator [Sedimentibacter acidaminivorans]|jgi:DNA-binding transcriptional MerR regulator|uniref:DNA-binding transcriptional MerR regulator n=1 Tax=Sedimentibacter acidaminivorans TaxID=913099 RepID=A0ABS4G9C4_9FIRM|nr:MerR family transcriptional regulator [Sedimentibacter acidaminivorans]MBP1924293.1 DNA-binding transcriptional MerR regulator [Sedimentibacter acidaminivorans]